MMPRTVALFVALIGVACAATRADGQPAPPRVDPFGDPLPDGAVARLGTGRLRHAGNVTSLVFSPDGKRLASAGYSPIVRIWSTANGKLLHSCNGHTTRIGGLDFSPDGKLLASASMDGSVCFWNAATGKEAHRIIDRRRDWFNNVHFAADGRHVTTVGQHGGICYWDIASGLPVKVMNIQQENWFKSGFSQDGRLLAVAGRDHAVQIWDVVSSKKLLEFAAHKESIRAAVFSPDGRYVASGGGREMVHLWEVATARLVTTLPANDSAFAFAPDGRTLASASDSEVHLWDLPTRKERRGLRGGDSGAATLAYSADGRLLATATRDGLIQLWDTATGREKLPLSGFDGAVAPLAFGLDGRSLVVQAGRSLRFWQLTPVADPRLPWNVKEIRRIEIAGTPAPNGRTFAAADSFRRISIWDIAEGVESTRLDREFELQNAVFSPDSTKLVACTGQTIGVWNAQSGKLIRTWRGPKTSRELSLAVSPDGKTLLVAGDVDPQLHFFDAETGKLIRQIPRPTAIDKRMASAGLGLPVAVSYSPAGRTIVLKEHSGVFLLDVATGTVLHKLPAALHLAYSPDGKGIATADKTRLRVWNPASGESIHEFPVPSDGVTGLLFSPDGKLLAAGAADMTVVLFDPTDGKR